MSDRASAPTAIEPTGPADEDAVELIPDWARTWWAGFRSRLTTVDLLAGAVALASSPLLLWLLVGGSFYIDDFRAQTYATDVPFWPFIVESNGTHLSPGARTLDWLQATYAPLNHGVAVAITLAIRLALLFVFWRLVRLLFGPRPLLLIPLALLATTPTLVPPSAWYRQSITAVVSAVCITWCTDQHVRWVLWRRGRNLVGAVLGLVVGLCFYEKSIIVLPWLLMLTILFLSPKPRHRTAGRTLIRTWPAWAAYSVVVAGFLVAYSQGPYDQGGGGQPLTLRLLADAAWIHLSKGFVPGLLGGPLVWDVRSQYYGVAGTPEWASAVFLVCAGVIIAWSLVRDRWRALRAWGLFASIYPLSLAIVAVGRMTRIGPIVGAEYRVWADLVVPALMCTLLAFLTPAVGPDRVGVAPSRRAEPMRPPLAVVVATALVLLASTVSTLRFATEWHRNPSGDYVAMLSKAVRGASTSAPANVLPLAPPQSVMPGWVEPGFDITDLLAPLHLRLDPYNHNLNTRAPSTSGNLVPLRLATVAKIPAGPAGKCGWGRPAGGDGPLLIPLQNRAPYFNDSGVMIGMLLGADSGLSIQLQNVHDVVAPDERDPLFLVRGPHEVFVRIPADTPVTALRITPTSPDAGLCVLRASVVVPEAIE